MGIYIYLIQHNSNFFEKFLDFHSETKKQLGKSLKMLQLDYDGEYIDTEFNDHLLEHRIFSQLITTPQKNGVLERRNRTSIDMVCYASPLTSFWRYTLQKTAYILNMFFPNLSLKLQGNCGWDGNLFCIIYVYGGVQHMFFKGILESSS